MPDLHSLRMLGKPQMTYVQLIQTAHGNLGKTSTKPPAKPRGEQSHMRVLKDMLGVTKPPALKGKVKGGLS